MNRDEITLMKMGEIKIDRVDYNISFYSSMEIKWSVKMAKYKNTWVMKLRKNKSRIFDAKNLYQKSTDEPSKLNLNKLLVRK